MEDKIKNLGKKKCCPDYYDFSQDSTLKDSLLLDIKRAYFCGPGTVGYLSDDELGLVNAAVKPGWTNRNGLDKKDSKKI